MIAGAKFRFVPLTEAWAGKPAVGIIIQIEDTRPQVMFLGDEAEHERTLRWIHSQPRLLALVRDAIDLRLERA